MSIEHAAIISQEMNLGRRQVAATIKLLQDGATIPFISRYRKEATGSLNEVSIRNIQIRFEALEQLEKRKSYIIDAIRTQGALTDELGERIKETLDPAVLEDIYLPYKPKRKTRACQARDLGLEPLAKIIMAQNSHDIERKAERFTSNRVPDIESAINGALDIISEWVSESEKARAIVRSRYMRSATISSKVVKGKEEEGKNYLNYFNFSEPLRLCGSHRYLAMRRGESEGILKISVSIDDDEMNERLCRMFIKQSCAPEISPYIRKAVKEGYRRLIKPTIEKEVSNLAKEKSDASAISMFADNVKQLLMSPPLGKKRVLAVDPGFRTGCKIVCLDEQGNLLTHDVIYPNPPANDFYGASDTLCFLVDKYRVDVIAVGNGTAGRDTEKFIENIKLPRKVQIFSVSEQGASIYSASDVAREEFPDYDVTVRGAVSIGRRLLDPLAELVKIEPKSIGVGQYQHDVNQPKLKEALDYTVESCVNSVGVNVNTASKQLLSYVSGIGPQLAENIVSYRTKHGPFKSRDELTNVPRMGEKAFQQSAGFLRIPGAINPLDNTAIHPESYSLLKQIAQDMHTDLERLVRDKNLYANIELDKYVTKDIGLPTLTDIIQELDKQGRDPRSEIETLTFDDNIRKIDDLHIGMEINGKVTNFTSFGAFVDIGLKENGLIHISQLSDRFVTNPAEVLALGQHVRVKIIDIDTSRNRIALTLKGVRQ